MNWNQGIRLTHRWVSMLFTVAVVIVLVAAIQQEAPAEWIFYLPLPPLAFLLFTGLYLFVLPYVAKWRNGRRAN